MLEFAFACLLLSGVSLPLTDWCKFPMVKQSLLGHQLTSTFMTYIWKPDWSIRWMKKRTETTELTENIDQKTWGKFGHAYSDEVTYYHSNQETWITCLRNHKTKGTWTSPGNRGNKQNRALWRTHQWKHQKPAELQESVCALIEQTWDSTNFELRKNKAGNRVQRKQDFNKVHWAC